MQIRSLYLHDFRNFRGPHLIRFTDDLTDAPQPLSVLAGTNGSGKSTVLGCIAALFQWGVDGSNLPGWTDQTWEKGFACVEFEFTEQDRQRFAIKPPARVVVWRGDERLVGPRWHDDWLLLADTSNDPSPPLYTFGSLVQRVSGPIAGQVLVVPSNRASFIDEGGPVEAPIITADLVPMLGRAPGWSGGLEQEWVWQNYLDLEEGAPRGGRLKPFNERLSHLLGLDRRIYIRQGRVWVTSGKPGVPDVRLSQLPSGEQQILFLLGELARRARPGAVVLLDEPEISLHPTLQHALVRQLESFAAEYEMQFILATHSREIVSAVPYGTQFLDHLEPLPEASLEMFHTEQAA